jgi:hypothetical protein
VGWLGLFGCVFSLKSREENGWKKKKKRTTKKKHAKRTDFPSVSLCTLNVKKEKGDGIPP